MTDLNPVTSEQLLDDRLDRIRKQKTSKLANQKHLAIILEAVDESLSENNDKKTATAYFVSFLSLMDQAISLEQIENKEMAQSTTYFLDLIAPYVSAPLLKAKFEQIVSKLSLALANDEADAPLLRSSIGALETVLIAQDLAGWQRSLNEMSPKRAMVALIQLGIDPRPKVRKRAQEAITKILSNPPPSPKVEHPASVLCAESSMQFVVKSIKESKKSKGNENSRIIHALQLVKAVTNANGWPSDKVDVLCETLLQICKTNEQFLISEAFKVFEAVFKSITSEMGVPKLVKILDTIMDLIPATNDVHIAPAWLAVVAQAGESYSDLEPEKAFNRLPKIFKTVITFLESENSNVQTSAAQCLVALITTAIPTEVLTLANKGNKKNGKNLEEICQLIFGLINMKYIGCWNETMEVLIALYDRLRWRSNPLLINHLKVVGALRSHESFEDGREAADKAIAAAIRNLGPETVLENLPLNLTDSSKQQRAWLLPLLRDNIQFANLGHFIKVFIPLGEWLHQQREEIIDAGELESRGTEAKIYETLYSQVWSLLPRYMDLPFDLQDAFTEDFAQSLAGILYSDVDKRPGICQSLRLLVHSNSVYASGEIDDDELLLERFPVKKAKKNIDFLAKNYALNVMKVMFNVFMSTHENSRGYVRECIETYLSITPEADVVKSFNEVCSALMEQLKQEKSNPEQFDHSTSKAVMDIIITMVKFLPEESLDAAARVFTTMVAREDNAQLQKRAFRILTRMTDNEHGMDYLKKNVAGLEQVLVEYRKKVAREARGIRLQAVSKIVEALPSDRLAFIASLLPETVISTKDQNGETRQEAYDLLVQMGHKMKVGGSVDQSQVPDVDDESAPTTEATLEEYFTMLSAGLAADHPHMISATITALSRVVYEFRDELSVEFLSQLASTVEVFLEHNSREIVKSALGFVKITAVSLPQELVEPQLKSIIDHMLVWARKTPEGGKAEFKNKVKNIIERLIRRFGYDKIAAVFPEDDMRFLTNIRKTKERQKRKTKQEPDAVKTRKYETEFDQALYGDSDVESESDDEEDTKGPKGKSTKYILEGEDEPLDLLDNKSLAHISSTKPKQQHGRPQLKHKFAKDQSGKLVIADNEDGDDDELAIKEGGIGAYVDAVKSGPMKGQRNRLKYKRSRDNQESDNESDDEAPKKPKPTKKQQPQKARAKQQPKRRKL